MPKSVPIKPGAIPREEMEVAFNAMLLRNKAMLWHICSDYGLGMAWKVEDCLQEVIFYLWRDYPKFEGRSSEKTWVYRVATNTMLMLRRKDTKPLSRLPSTNKKSTWQRTRRMKTTFNYFNSLIICQKKTAQ